VTFFLDYHYIGLSFRSENLVSKKRANTRSSGQRLRHFPAKIAGQARGRTRGQAPTREFFASEAPERNHGSGIEPEPSLEGEVTGAHRSHRFVFVQVPIVAGNLHTSPASQFSSPSQNEGDVLREGKREGRRGAGRAAGRWASEKPGIEHPI